MDGTSLSAQDALWLTMDRENNLMVIDVAVVLDGIPSRETVHSVFSALVQRHPVFRRVARRRAGAWRWVDDPDFDVVNHLAWVELPAGSGMSEVQAEVSAQRSVQLDRDRPLWAASVVAPVSLEDGSTGSVIVARFHHAIADGVRLTQVLLGVLDATFVDSVPTVARGGVAGGSALTTGALLSLPAEWTRMAASAARSAAALAGRAVTEPADVVASGVTSLSSGLGAIQHPDRLVDALEVLGAEGHRSVNDLTAAGKLVLGASDRAVWTGRPGIRKGVAWSPRIALNPLKEAARARGVTLNDLLVGALAGALKAYLSGRGDDAAEVVWMVPVNLKPFSADLPEDLGNHFALVMLDMPLDGDTPADRIDALHHRMERIKNSDEPVMTFGLQRTISLTPDRMATFLTDFFANKAVGVLTNVPGPTRVLRLGDIQIRQVIGFAPCSGDQPLTATIFTYAGTVTIGFASDLDLVPDPQTLVSLVESELEGIRDLAP